MTDLISSLADSIVALINSKPQSPTKAEVEAIVREHVERSVMRIKADADVLASHPIIHVGPGRVLATDYWDWAIDPATGSAETAPAQDRAVPGLSMRFAPLPYKEPSPELMQLMERNTKALKDAMNTSVYGGPTKEDRDRWWAKHLNEPLFVEDIASGTVLEFLGDKVPAGWSLIEAILHNGVVVRVKCRKA